MLTFKTMHEPGGVPGGIASVTKIKLEVFTGNHSPSSPPLQAATPPCQTLKLSALLYPATALPCVIA